MFHWTPEKKASVEKMGREGVLTPKSIAKAAGCNVKTILKFFHSADILPKRIGVVKVSKEKKEEVLTLWDQGHNKSEIAKLVGISRVSVGNILGSDPHSPVDDCWSTTNNKLADLEFQDRLHAVHPGQFYEDCAETETEFTPTGAGFTDPHSAKKAGLGQPLPMRARTIEPYESDAAARYKVDQSHLVPRKITLATSAGEFSYLSAA